MKKKLTVKWCWQSDYIKTFEDEFITTTYIVGDTVMLVSGKVSGREVEKALEKRHGKNAVLLGYGYPTFTFDHDSLTLQSGGWWVTMGCFDMTPELSNIAYWGC